MPVVTDKYANFLKLNDTGTFHADGIARQLEKKGLLAKGKGKQIEQEIDANFRLRQQYDPLMRDALARNEFDGIKYANQQEGADLFMQSPTLLLCAPDSQPLTPLDAMKLTY